MNYKNPFKTFTKFEWILWISSIILIMVLFLMIPKRDIYTLCASLIGVTALVLLAKGDVMGQILTVVFSLLYALISYRFHYYGEMITYLGMTAPIAILSAISWIRHPYEESKNEVKIADLNRANIFWLVLLTIVVTITFYFVLKLFDTANLFVSTLSIATSFSASALMFLRSPYYAVAYAGNDVVLVILWIFATMSDISFFPMILCFVIFCVNDIYGFINWRKMRGRQNETKVICEG